MANLTIDLNKSVEQNAAVYYEKAKKAKRKLEGALAVVRRYEQELQKLERPKPEAKETKKAVKREWFEKYRWFYSSEGFLVIGGRDATTNDMIIKKHAAADDIVFHTDMAGSPFFVIKTEGKKPGNATMQEAADATCSFSRAWKLGLSTQSVFHVAPEQVTKTANTGEYLTKGAFVIRGRTNYLPNRINLAAGIYGGRIMCAPLEAVKKHCKDFIVLKQGALKPSDAAKIIRKKLSHDDLDEIIRALPSGNIEL